VYYVEHYLEFNMSRLLVLPYQSGSISARTLQRALDEHYKCRRLLLTGAPFLQRGTDIIINWGRAGAVRGIEPTLNSYAAINRTGNKRLCFKDLDKGDVSIPSYTTDISVARDWLEQGATVVERHSLRGHSGQGIKLKRDSDVLEDCPLYVKYVPKQSEYRVHVFGNTIIDVRQKRRRRCVPDSDVNWQIRNERGGFVYAMQNVNPHQMVLDESLKAIKATGLDFGAVDVIWNESQQKAYVLEVNTACGLEGTTINNYVDAVLAYLHCQEPKKWEPTHESDGD
jgi:glutathione synthase/RimK-type ligase-like ATP-grasp enzyme